MAKKKVQEVKLIQDLVQRNVTYCKRKKVLLKKSMELSILCGQDVSVIIHDKKKKSLVVYRSTPDFTSNKIDRIE